MEQKYTLTVKLAEQNLFAHNVGFGDKSWAGHAFLVVNGPNGSSSYGYQRTGVVRSC